MVVKLFNKQHLNNHESISFRSFRIGQNLCVPHASKKGINAYDADDIEDLFAWYDRSGKEVPPPQSADVAMKNQYAFLWSKKMLARFLVEAALAITIAWISRRTMEEFFLRKKPGHHKLVPVKEIT